MNKVINASKTLNSNADLTINEMLRWYSAIPELPLEIAGIDEAPLIEPGEIVCYYDDFTGKYEMAIYLGWYEDFNNAGEVSPYFNEDVDGVARLMVRRLRGGVDYVLPEHTRAASSREVYEWEISQIING